MLILLRIIFTGAFIYCIAQARQNARTNLEAGDLTQAGWLAVGVIAAIAAAVAWAPYFGAKVADPLTGGMVNSPSVERRNFIMELVRRLDKKEKYPGLIRWL